MSPTSFHLEQLTFDWTSSTRSGPPPCFFRPKRKFEVFWIAIFVLLSFLSLSVSLEHALEPHPSNIKRGLTLKNTNSTKNATSWLVNVHSQHLFCSFQIENNFQHFDAWMLLLAEKFSLINPKDRSPLSPASSQTGSQIKRNSDQLDTRKGDFYPAYRFYSLASKAYLSKGNLSRTVVAQNSNPFGRGVEWEWLTQTSLKGAYLRNRETKDYLCFNSYGRPAIRKNAKPLYCLLHGSLPNHPLLLQHLRDQFPETSDKKKQQHQKHSFPTNLSWDSSTTVHEGSDATQSNSSTDSNTQRSGWDNYQHRDSHPRFSIPAVIHLWAKMHYPVWPIGFCRNGRPLANLRPYSGACSHTHLPTLWNYLLVCPPIPSICRQRCHPSEDTGLPSQPSKRLHAPFGPGCPRDCEYSIYCGLPPRLFQSVSG
ncbi:hypothetical protein AAHC03_0498 [Spirometra sp. Aus1]